MSKEYKEFATCVNKYARGELRRRFIFVGKKQKNEYAEYHLIFQIDEEECDFLVNEFEYECVEIDDSGYLEYEILLNSYKIISFNNQINRRRY